MPHLPIFWDFLRSPKLFRTCLCLVTLNEFNVSEGMEIDKAIRDCDDRRLKTKYNNAIYVVKRALSLYSWVLLCRFLMVVWCVVILELMLIGFLLVALKLVVIERINFNLTLTLIRDAWKPFNYLNYSIPTDVMIGSSLWKLLVEIGKMIYLKGFI